MEPGDSSQHSQMPATSTYPEPDRSNLKSYQNINPVPRLPVWTFHNQILFFYGEELLAPRPTHQAGGPPLVGCPRLLIQYIRSCPSILEAVPPSATWGRAMPWWQGPTYHGLSEVDLKKLVRRWRRLRANRHDLHSKRASLRRCKKTRDWRTKRHISWSQTEFCELVAS